MKKGLLVIGLGISGLSAALLGKRAGYDVYVTERELNSRNKSRFDLLDVHGIAYETENSGRFFGLCSLAVISPGIDPRSEYIREVAAEMEIISEIEFAYMLMDDPYIIGITGTNGKSTTVSLIHEILCDQGVDSVLTGNIGTPLSEKAMERHEVYVCELSSYQLERIRTFRAMTAAVINVTPDHLNRYDDLFDKYAATKLDIYKNSAPGDIAVINCDDEFLSRPENIPGRRVLSFSLNGRCGEGYYYEDGAIVRSSGDGDKVLMKSDELALPGLHNVQNVLAALCSVQRFVRDWDLLIGTLRRFSGIEHRIEYVTEFNNITIYNDSKGTNVDSTDKALKAFPGKKIVLILGGDDAKKSDFQPLYPLVRENCSKVVLIGETTDRIYDEVAGLGLPVFKAGTMKDAVACAMEKAVAGEVVLLSPAAASFDMFANFEERGKIFKQEVERYLKGYHDR